MSNYNVLRAINVNQHAEKKNNLTYLSWAWAWDIFIQENPDATYEVVKDANGLPYFESHAGVMVYTKVTSNNITHEMWLPVMDGANKAMKREAYNYKTKYGEKSCDAFDMFDVNKTIMRCLVKNLAMFGLGLYIYAGEDLPENEEVKPAIKPSPVTPFATKLEVAPNLLPPPLSQDEIARCITTMNGCTEYEALKGIYAGAHKRANELQKKTLEAVYFAKKVLLADEQHGYDAASVQEIV